MNLWEKARQVDELAARVEMLTERLNAADVSYEELAADVTRLSEALVETVARLGTLVSLTTTLTEAVGKAQGLHRRYR